MTPPDGRDVAEAVVDLEGQAKVHWEHRRDRWANPFPVRVAEWEELPDDLRNLEIAAMEAADALRPTPATAGEPSTAEERDAMIAAARQAGEWCTQGYIAFPAEAIVDAILALRTAPASSVEGGVEVERLREAEMQNFLDGVIGAVEASSFERYALWAMNRERKESLAWVSELSGLMEIIGHVGDMPVCLSLSKATVDGHPILFYDATSTVVDHRMVRSWLERALPKTAYDGGRINNTDANNFHNVFPRAALAPHQPEGGE